MKNNYSISDNVRDWLFTSPWIILLGLLPLAESPLLGWLHGICVGAMGVWAMSIFERWTENLIKQDDEENEEK